MFHCDVFVAAAAMAFLGSLKQGRRRQLCHLFAVMLTSRRHRHRQSLFKHEILL